MYTTVLHAVLGQRLEGEHKTRLPHAKRP